MVTVTSFPNTPAPPIAVAPSRLSRTPHVTAPLQARLSAGEIVVSFVHGYPLRPRRTFLPLLIDEPPATAPIYASEWSPASSQNTIPELNEALGVTAQEFHSLKGELHLSVTLPDSPAMAPRSVMVWIHGSS